ncbi:MAG: hypothetical protein ACR2O0_08665 [Rhizobiaceae bacterium]
MAKHARQLLKTAGVFAVLAAFSSGVQAQPYSQASMFLNADRQLVQKIDYDDYPEDYYAQEELDRLLHPHFWFGGRVSDAVRAATGDPNISVIDRRTRRGDVYECNFQFWGIRKQRVMVCD